MSLDALRRHYRDTGDEADRRRLVREECRLGVHEWEREHACVSTCAGYHKTHYRRCARCRHVEAFEQCWFRGGLFQEATIGQSNGMETLLDWPAWAAGETTDDAT